MRLITWQKKTIVEAKHQIWWKLSDGFCNFLKLTVLVFTPNSAPAARKWETSQGVNFSLTVSFFTFLWLETATTDMFHMYNAVQHRMSSRIQRLPRFINTTPVHKVWLFTPYQPDRLALVIMLYIIILSGRNKKIFLLFLIYSIHNTAIKDTFHWNFKVSQWVTVSDVKFFLQHH